MLRDDVKVMLRVSSDDFDGEIDDLIAYAKADMIRVGIDPDIVASDENPLVKMAIGSYCKSNFGFDLDRFEASRLNKSYRQIVCDLMNSGANIAAGGADD